LVMHMRGYLQKFAGIAVASGLVATTILVGNGCTTEPYAIVVTCKPDADPDADVNGFCFGDGGTGIEPASMKCEDRGGSCIAMGTADFRKEAVLLWMGAEEDEPDCPDRAEGVFYEGYGDLTVSLPCQACSCGPATCALPSAIDVHGSAFCGGNATSYAAPESWDGSCVSPSVLSSGSFSSIKLAAPTVGGCEPIGDPLPGSPSFAPRPASFADGIYWGKYAKACQGTAQGMCESSSDLCLPSTEPPPPEFRQCVQYTLPVDEANPPTCPDAFPERFLFYRGTEGKPECSPCECGEAVGGSCSATLSVYQDSACAGQPMPLFQNVPALPGLCIDFNGSSVPLGSMSAKWVQNEPGTCEVKGGEPVGQVKGVDPRVFCCQGLATE
jgi:hypothetical protein